MRRCQQELCRNWAGNEGCPCAVLDLEPDIADDARNESTPNVDYRQPDGRWRSDVIHENWLRLNAEGRAVFAPDESAHADAEPGHEAWCGLGSDHDGPCLDLADWLSTQNQHLRADRDRLSVALREMARRTAHWRNACAAWERVAGSRSANTSRRG